MKLHKVIAALSNATAENPLGEDSLLPYWDFFWAEDEKANISSQDKIRIFLLHIYFHYFNDKAENSAIFVNLDWPDWMFQIARRHTRDAIGLFHAKDGKTVSEIASENGLVNFGWFSEAGPWGNNRLETNDGPAGTLLRPWPRRTAQLMIYPCPALGDFGARIHVAPEEPNGTFERPYLWAIEPYDLMIGLIE